MELILWRHADAELGEPDQDRSITAKGHKQARKMAAWLDHNLPNSCRILVSPSIRTIQTAEALGRKFKVLDELAPGASAQQVLTAAHWPDSREPVLVIGHQPTLGQVAALVIGGSEQNWSIRKGSIWWLVQREREGNTEHYIRVVMAPELLNKAPKHIE